MLRGLLPLLVSLLVAGSLHAGLTGRGRAPRPRVPAETRAGKLRMDMHMELSDEQIQVVIRTSEPVAGLRMAHALEGEERAGWRVSPEPTGPRLRWERDGKTDRLLADAPTDRFALRVPLSSESTGLLWRRGELRFLDVEQLRPLPLEPETRPEYGFELRADEKTWLLGAGKTARGSLRLGPGAADLLRSTPVYLGPREPVDYGEFHMLTGPGLEGWIRDAAHAYLPRIHDAFSRMTGGPISWRPLVLLTRRPSTDPEFQDVLAEGQGAVLELVTEGGGFALESPEGTLDWVWLASHHLFHLWNQEAFAVAHPEEETFLGEGAAEYATLLALSEVDLVSDEEWTRLAREKAVRCAAGEPGPLVGATGNRASDCGTTLFLVADSWIRRLRKGAAGSAHLFTGLLDRAGAEDYRYSRYDLLETIRDLSRTPEPSRRLGAWIERGLEGDLREALEALLEDAGYPLKLEAPR